MPSSLHPPEIVAIVVVPLVLLGLKRLPEAGRQVGMPRSDVRRWTQDVRYEMNQAFQAETAPPPPPPPTPPPVVASPAPVVGAAPIADAPPTAGGQETEVTPTADTAERQTTSPTTATEAPADSGR